MRVLGVGFRSAWTLGFVAPAILAAAFTIDVALRFLPLDLFSFRAWEVFRRDYPPPNGPFAPNRAYHSGKVYGDLAALGNLRALREYRSETFTTDAYGYRNPPAFTRPAAVLVGSSFAAGAGVSDDETPAAQLSAVHGQPVFNSAGTQSYVEDLLSLTHRLGLRGGVVIYEALERVKFPAEAPVLPWKRPATVCSRLFPVPGLRSACADWSTRLSRFQKVSPLKILAQRAYRALENDDVLPNTLARRNVIRARLGNGDPMLFLSEEVADAGEQRSEDEAVRYFTWLQGLVRQQDLGLLVVLVPDKYTVYSPLIAGHEGPPADPAYLERLELGLHANGIAVVNLAPAFRAAAARDLARGIYIYWRDDSHWNARGIALAATEIERGWRELGSGRCTVNSGRGHCPGG